jgi:hypothetical protein
MWPIQDLALLQKTAGMEAHKKRTPPLSCAKFGDRSMLYPLTTSQCTRAELCGLVVALALMV